MMFTVDKMNPGQPLLFPPVSVPALDTARFSMRRQGDGMDSEALQVNRPTTSPNLGQKRHTNLNSSARSTSVTKTTSSSTIPHEPVKGAVKAVNVGDSQIKKQNILSSGGNIEQKELKSYQYNMGAPTEIVTPDVPNQRSNTSGQIFADIQSTVQYKNKNNASKTTETTKVIKVPVFSGPSHLKYSTYETLSKAEEQNKLDKKKRSTVTENTPDSTDQNCVIEVPQDNDRQVEGQQAKPNSEKGQEKLQKELDRVKEQLSVQFKVNADLKKLLVASVGDDLHYKVETLVRTKAHLSEEIGGYTKKMSKDYEDIDQLSIQADMWRSKYMACRMLTDQLAGDKEQLSQRWADAERALQHMLQEREQLNEWMIETHRHVKLIRDSFDPSSSHKCPTIPNMLELARDNLLLSESAKFRLLGSISVFRAALDAGIQNGPTPAEKLAYQVLSNKTSSQAIGTASIVPGRLSSELLTRMERFHPLVRYDNITLNCCRKCKGEIQVV